MLQSTNGDIRRVNFSIGFASFEGAEVGITLRQLDLNAGAREIGNLGLAACGQTQHVGVVELYLSAGCVAGGNLITADQRRVQCGGRPVTESPRCMETSP